MLFYLAGLRQVRRTMMKKLLLLAPLSMLALAACNSPETPASDAVDGATAVTPVAEIEMPPAITATGTYRCADNSILYVDFLGANEAADIRVGEKSAIAVRVTVPKAEVPATDAAASATVKAAPADPLTSTDGESSLSGSGKQINVKLAGKSAQTCKSS